jgi:ABC-type lipoprotein export system ATPase subunit
METVAIDYPHPTDLSARSVLTIRRLRKTYGERVILRDLDLELKAAERVALMGPSGSGKTTLLNVVGGIDGAESGEVVFEGRELTGLSDDARADLRRRAIGTVFQFFHLLPTLTVWENVELPLLLIDQSAKERRERVRSLLEETGVHHRADALPEALSGGEMQRVAIARALAPEPRLLLADEPTGNLDSKTGERILDLMEAVCERHRTALLMVTHNAASTRICHRTLHMRDGQFIEERPREMAGRFEES